MTFKVWLKNVEKTTDILYFILNISFALIYRFINIHYYSLWCEDISIHTPLKLWFALWKAHPFVTKKLNGPLHLQVFLFFICLHFLLGFRLWCEFPSLQGKIVEESTQMLELPQFFIWIIPIYTHTVQEEKRRHELIDRTYLEFANSEEQEYICDSWWP